MLQVLETVPVDLATRAGASRYLHQERALVLLLLSRDARFGYSSISDLALTSAHRYAHKATRPELLSRSFVEMWCWDFSHRIRVR